MIMYKPERLAAFCDGVVAIAITLLVLGLEVPTASKVPEQDLKAYLYDMLHPLIGYISSFVLIGTYWLAHYVIFHHVVRVDRIFIALNGLFLCLVAFVPFPTGVQATYRGDPIAFLLYAITHVACSLSLCALWLYATRGHRLVDTSLPDTSIAMIQRRLLLPPAVCVMAMLLSAINLNLGRLVFLLIPLFYFVRPGMDERGGSLDSTTRGKG